MQSAKKLLLFILFCFMGISNGTLFAATWTSSAESLNIAYFLFSSPNKIERYDMNSKGWLTPINLPDTPTAFTVDDDGIYVSFGRRTSRFTLEGSGETHLINTSSDVQTLLCVNDFLYIHFSDKLLCTNKITGEEIDSKDYHYSMTGLSVAPARMKLFARSSGVSPSDILHIPLNPDGTMGDQDDSPYHGAYPRAYQTFVFPGEGRIIDDAGIVYNPSDLTYNNSLAGSFDDIAFYGDIPIVLRDNTLVGYSNALLETGHYTPAEHSPEKI